MCKRITVLVCVGVLINLLAATAWGGFREDLLAHWPMDEDAGSSVADVVGGFDGTIEGDVTWTQGMIGSAIGFPGATGNYVDCGNVDINIGSNFTLACWLKAPETTTYHDLFGKGPKDAGHFELYLEGSTGGGRLDGDIAAYIPDLGDFYSNIKVDDETWHHIAWTYDGTTLICYVDGGDTGMKTWSVSGSVAAESAEFKIGCLADTTNPFNGQLDDLAIFSRALSQEEIQATMLGLAEPWSATNPSPVDMAVDTPRDVVLSWTPGKLAATHDVYLGTNVDDVNLAGRANPLGVLVSQGQTGTSYDLPVRLEFGQTYYWRVDEVNAAPDNTIFKGEVWSLTAETFAYPIIDVTATSNGVSDAGAGPERTVDGSGLDTADQHSTDAADMWLTTLGADPLQVQYEFDAVYKLHEMLVWNYNFQFELVMGFGTKGVTVEYSQDGTDWTALGDVELVQATGQADYTANTMVAFGGVPARYVRLTVNSGYSMVGQFGLSEVRFMSSPVSAREPQPVDGDTGVLLGTALNWRSGRGAVAHHVHFSTDEMAVASGAAAVDVVAESHYEPGELDVASTYYWKVNEVNEAEAVSTWEGSIWSFTTQESLLVENFESYTDDTDAGEAIWQNWIDGYEDSANGSIVGHDEAPFAERQIVFNGSQSMIFAYDNGVAKISETERTWIAPQDWTGHGVDVLRLWYKGAVAPGSISLDTASSTYTMASSGADIWGTADSMHFAYVELTGNGSITARVDGITNGGIWAKVGVMVRESLEPGAVQAMMAVTPANLVSFVHRLSTGGGTTDANGDADAFTMPHWVRVTREGNILRGEHSTDGVNWSGPTADATDAEVGAFLPQTVYVGLAMSSFRPGEFAQATFSDVKTTGTVAGGAFVTSQDIGITNNASEPLFVVVEDAAGHSAAVPHSDGATAVNASIWTPWDIPLSEFTNSGVNTSAIKRMIIGVGDRSAPVVGGAGQLYFDDIQLRKSEIASDGPILHLDASALDLQDGDPVVEWGSASAAGTPLFQQSQTPGGGPAVLLDGSSHFGQVTLPCSSAGDFILVAVISPEDINAYHNIIDDDAKQRPMLWVDNRSPSTYEANYSATGAIAAEAGGTGAEQWDIIIMDSRSGTFYLNSPTVTHFMDTVPWLPAAGSQGFGLFNRDGGAAFQGRVAELRIYNDARAFGLDFGVLYEELFDKWFVGEGQ